MYYDKRKKYAILMEKYESKDNRKIVGYDILYTNEGFLGWEKLKGYEVIKKDGKEMIDLEMIKMIRELIYEDYQFLGKKTK